MAILDQINDVLEQIRPSLQADGGDVEFISYENNVVNVRLQGACGSCPMSTMTLKHGIEAAMMKAIPEVKAVEQVF